MRKSSAGSPWRAMLGVAALIIVFAASPARAGPVIQSSDQADNDYFFRYRNGRIRTAASSTILRRRDKVSFFAYVYERPGAPNGRRLDGVLELTLATSRSVRYDGRFAFIVRTENGSKVLRMTEHRSFTLRPSPGQRREIITFHFDLKRGRYWAFARFRTPDK
jgi:hypothetical protein